MAHRRQKEDNKDLGAPRISTTAETSRRQAYHMEYIDEQKSHRRLNRVLVYQGPSVLDEERELG